MSISTKRPPPADLSLARAYWLCADTLVWNVLGRPKFSYELFFDSEGGLELTPQGLKGGQSIALSFSPAGPGDRLTQFPHLAGFVVFTIAPADLPKVPEILRGQLAIAARDEMGKLIDATSLQIPGVLDDLFSYDGPLGLSWEPSSATGQVRLPRLRAWAPTARSVSLLRFADSAPASQPIAAPMEYDPITGVWSVEGEPGWQGQYYLYEVEVYAPASGKVERNLVTDPYSLSLSTNSARSQIVDLNDPALTPAGWADLRKPELAAPNDSVIYELHVRDFSISDASVPADLRGTFAAFALPASNGTRHLRELAQAGVTHIHLLPIFDIATIEEDRARQVPLPLEQLAALPPDSPAQQALLWPLRDKDGFNWGYDPLHYNVPEGSYSTDPDGPQRIVEFRQLVQALNRMGLRVVIDVVYNHTNASGQAEKSVLDRIVPGYYHRLDDKGEVTNSTCCSNTATEHAMMEKLMIDSVLLWARQYKVDGFRFDLMGHHMKRNMVKLRAALDGLTVAQDGVDGKAIYVYGEGWDFGEVADNGRGENATQINMADTGIGTFSDRLRDAVRGGRPFDDPRLQGFATGLYSEPSAYEQGNAEMQRSQLLEYSDWIRLGLAGNLKHYELTDRAGRQLRGELVQYHGASAGYTLAPQEHIVYVAAHDNETLFDVVQLKAPASADLAQRVRMHNLAISLTALSQGIPFFHAGDELLRSKSLDRNSYNSSDWFNRIDWTGETSNFGVGLPPAGDNQAHWSIMAPLLADAALRPGPQQIGAAYAHFKELLAIRTSSPLFRLRSAEQIQAALRFANTGPDQLPGLIVMILRAVAGGLGCGPQWGQIVVLFNANRDAVEYAVDDLIGLPLELHPIQQVSTDQLVRETRFDPDSGSFSLPGRTTAVFVGVIS